MGGVGKYTGVWAPLVGIASTSNPPPRTTRSRRTPPTFLLFFPAPPTSHFSSLLHPPSARRDRPMEPRRAHECQQPRRRRPNHYQRCRRPRLRHGGVLQNVSLPRPLRGGVLDGRHLCHGHHHVRGWRAFLSRPHSRSLQGERGGAGGRKHEVPGGDCGPSNNAMGSGCPMAPSLPLGTTTPIRPRRLPTRSARVRVCRATTWCASCPLPSRGGAPTRTRFPETWAYVTGSRSPLVFLAFRTLPHDLARFCPRFPLPSTYTPVSPLPRRTKSK